jgi:hypothetical protein
LVVSAVVLLGLFVATVSPVFASGPGVGSEPPPSHDGGALPSVNPAHPISVVTIGEGDNAWTVTTRLVPGGTVPGGVQPMDSLTCNKTSSPGYCTCISSASRGVSVYGASLQLTTNWNFDYSTVWMNMGQGKSSHADPPLHWENFSLWMSGQGTAYAYSDVTADLMDGVGWASIQVGSMHIWHQVDAWGNCTPHVTWNAL